MDSAEFWAVIQQQLRELRGACNADDVIRILSRERNPYEQMPGHEGMVDGDGFFAGSGSDPSVYEVLTGAAGWQPVWYEADYYWCLRSGGSFITYVEGDVYRGDRRTYVE